MGGVLSYVCGVFPCVCVLCVCLSHVCVCVDRGSCVCHYVPVYPYVSVLVNMYLSLCLCASSFVSLSACDPFMLFPLGCKFVIIIRMFDTDHENFHAVFLCFPHIIKMELQRLSVAENFHAVCFCISHKVTF